MEIRQQEALAYLQNCSERFDLIFTNSLIYLRARELPALLEP